MEKKNILTPNFLKNKKVLLLCGTECKTFVCTFHSYDLCKKGQILSSYNGSRSENLKKNHHAILKFYVKRNNR